LWRLYDLWLDVGSLKRGTLTESLGKSANFCGGLVTSSIVGSVAFLEHGPAKSTFVLPGRDGVRESKAAT